eukprot:scaffold10789_cov141-Isochrysis_galbana.AAC.8
MDDGGGGGKGHTHLWSKDNWGTLRGGTCADCDTRAKCPVESYGPHLEEPRARARRGRSCCCRSIVAEDDNQHEDPAAATSSRTIAYMKHEARHASLRVSG